MRSSVFFFGKRKLYPPRWWATIVEKSCIWCTIWNLFVVLTRPYHSLVAQLKKYMFLFPKNVLIMICHLLIDNITLSWKNCVCICLHRSTKTKESDRYVKNSVFGVKDGPWDKLKHLYIVFMELIIMVQDEDCDQ